MEGTTIKTLAEYIAKLHQTHTNLEHPEEYVHDELDTNGVAQDHVETFWPPDNKWAHLNLIHRLRGALGQVVPNQRRFTRIVTSKVSQVTWKPAVSTGCLVFALELTSNIPSEV